MPGTWAHKSFLSGSVLAGAFATAVNSIQVLAVKFYVLHALCDQPRIFVSFNKSFEMTDIKKVQ